MAKKNNKAKAQAQASAHDAKESIKDMANRIMESGQQIWQAGLGAFSKAQEEGGKLYEALVKEGSALEKITTKYTSGKVEEVRGAVESTVNQVKDRASDTWDKLEKVFEERVSRALGGLGIPGRDELNDLARKVDDLAKAVKGMSKGGVEKASVKAAVKPVVKAASKPAPKAAVKAPVKATAKPVVKTAKKVAVKAVAKKATVAVKAVKAVAEKSKGAASSISKSFKAASNTLVKAAQTAPAKAKAAVENSAASAKKTAQAAVKQVAEKVAETVAEVTGSN